MSTTTRGADREIAESLARTRARLDRMDWEEWRLEAALPLLAVVGADGKLPAAPEPPPETLAEVIPFRRR